MSSSCERFTIYPRQHSSSSRSYDRNKSATRVTASSPREAFPRDSVVLVFFSISTEERKEEPQSNSDEHLQHLTTPFLVVQGSAGSGRRQVLSAVLVQRCRPERGCHPVFTSVIWENGAHPFFRENKRENGTPKTQCFRWRENNMKTLTFPQTHCNH